MRHRRESDKAFSRTIPSGWVGTLGRPDGFRTQGEYTVLKYTNRLISGWSWDRADYFVILKDDKGTEYGSGEVREKNVGGIHSIFIHQY
jgi:hypothetical protein